MHKLLSSKIVPLSRELAEELATMRATPGERRLSKSRLDFLRNKFDEGIFHTPTWVIATIGGIRYRVNGQHSSNMLCTLNGQFPTGTPVMLMEFTGDTQSDLAELFGQFDAKESARSIADITTAHARIHSELNHISPTDIGRVISGLAWANGVSKKIGTAERAQLIHEHQPFTVWVHEFVKAKKLHRAPVVAAMYSTWLKAPDAAQEFWSMVRDENHSDANHPSRIIANFLRDSIVSERTIRTAMKFPSEAFYAKCIHAWNAYRTGKNTALKVYDTGTLPKPL